MLAQSLAEAEPGEDDGDSSPDGGPLLEPAALAHKEQGGIPVLFKACHVGAVQKDLRGAPWSGNFKHGQLARPLQKGDAGGGFKVRDL